MKLAFWKLVAIVQAVCIVALLVAGGWWMRQVKLRTRTATLRALYDYLALPPQRDGVYVPVVVDVKHDQQQARYFVNGDHMDTERLSRYAKDVLQSDDPFVPFVVRTALDTPFPQIAAAMQVLIGNGVKVLGLPMGEGLLLLTDRSFLPRGDVGLPPETVFGPE